MGLTLVCTTKQTSSTTNEGTYLLLEETNELIFLEGESCKWEGSWSDLDSHLATCNYVKVKCPFCPEVVLRRDIDEHTQTCEYRIVACEFCKINICLCDLQV